jgi:phospholipase/carboxylesterase
MTDSEGWAEGIRVLQAGTPLREASAAMVLVHGRGASAEDIMLLGQELSMPGFTYLAPQAPGNTWYPNRYSAPIPSNEPWLSSALEGLEMLLSRVEEVVLLTRTVLLGFSQGACLTLEFAARHARRYGGVVGLSGALIGLPETPRNYPGSLERTPVFLGCSDVDPHVAAADVLVSADVLRRLGGDVTARLYPGLGHEVNEDELDHVRGLMRALLPEGDGVSEE